MELVTKSQYARMRNREPSAVSNWIAGGKLAPPALVQQDGKELIDVAAADAMLAERLDPSQQLAQDTPIETELDDDDAELLDDIETKVGSSKSGSITETRRYLTAKAEEKELDVERKKRAMMADSGRWLETAVAEKAFAQKLAAIFTDLEAWVSAAGEELATELGTDIRATTLALRESMRRFRERQAAREEEAAERSDAAA